MLESLGLKSLSLLLLLVFIPAMCIRVILGMLHELRRGLGRP